MSSITAGTTSTTTLIHSGDTTGSLVFKTNDTGSGGTTAVTIDTSQNVGIGGAVTNEGGYAKVLQITGSTDCVLELKAGSSYSYLAQNGTTLQIRNNDASGAMTFSTNATERMRIQASGALSFANTTDTGAYNAVLGYRNNHFMGQRSNTVAANTTSTMLTLNFNLNGAAIVRVVDTGTVQVTNYYTNVYEYFITCYNGTVTATLKQSQLGAGAGSYITTSTGSSTFNVIQLADSSQATMHDTAVDVLACAAGNFNHATMTITMAANN